MVDRDWEDILREHDLAMTRATPDWLVYVNDTDPHQRERPRAVGSSGGLLCREYRIGDKAAPRITYLLCRVCQKTFESPRSQAIYCGRSCENKAYRARVRANASGISEGRDVA